MPKENKRHKGFLKLDPPGYIVGPKQKTSRRSLLNDDYDFDSQAGLSESLFILFFNKNKIKSKSEQ